MISILTSNQINLPLQEATVEHAVQATLAYASATQEVDLTIVFSDDRQLHQLNFQFLGIDAPTDVLSFPAGFTDPDTRRAYLGDILISIPRAQAQAEEHKHALQDELLLLIVHGVLHLLGYDHARQVEKDEMWSIQSKILFSLQSSN